MEENKQPLESHRMIFIDGDKTYDHTGKELPKHEPKKYPLQKYEIWIEGFIATGESATATKLSDGTYGRNFQDACMRHFLLTEFNHRNTAEETYYYDTKRWDYDPYTNKYWGCKLFDNETDARKSYG